MKASLDRPGGDLQRLLDALKEQWQLTGLVCDGHILAQLQACLRAKKWCVTVAVREERQLVGIWPGFRDRVLGVAVDVGSTTVAAHLCDLTSGEVLGSEGVMNPQIRFGEDLMSRVSYVMMNPDGDLEMTRVVREVINKLIAKLTANAEVTASDVLEITLVGNPIMHHLLLGISPVELRIGQKSSVLAYPAKWKGGKATEFTGDLADPGRFQGPAASPYAWGSPCVPMSRIARVALPSGPG